MYSFAAAQQQQQQQQWHSPGRRPRHAAVVTAPQRAGAILVCAATRCRGCGAHLLGLRAAKGCHAARRHDQPPRLVRGWSAAASATAADDVGGIIAPLNAPAGPLLPLSAAAAAEAAAAASLSGDDSISSSQRRDSRTRNSRHDSRRGALVKVRIPPRRCEASMPANVSLPASLHSAPHHPEPCPMMRPPHRCCCPGLQVQAAAEL